MILSIDYGSKLAGTTAVCFEKNNQLHLAQSVKKQDADAWLRQLISTKKPAAVYIDAPLSLPGVYRGEGSDYFYRAGDRAVGAMSPMFLGGLTARAMQLRAAFPAIPASVRCCRNCYPCHWHSHPKTGTRRMRCWPCCRVGGTGGARQRRLGMKKRG
jgi:hypothetical protein